MRSHDEVALTSPEDAVAHATVHGEQPTADVGEACHLLAWLMPALPHGVAADVATALSTELVMPSAAVVRRERLATLLAFLAVHHRRPSAAEYRAEHDRRSGQGLPSVPIATLASHYGSFAHAVAMAVRLHIRGTASRVPRRIPAPGRSWTPSQTLDALDRIRAELGHWPVKNEYRALHGASEGLRAAHGLAELEMPDPNVVKRLFGSYGEALRAAKERVEQRRIRPVVTSEPRRWQQRKRPSQRSRSSS